MMLAFFLRSAIIFLLVGIFILLVVTYLRRLRRRQRDRAGKPHDDLVPYREFRWQTKEGTFKVYVDKGSLHGVAILYDHSTLEWKDGNIPIRDFLTSGSPWQLPKNVEKGLREHIARHIL